MEEVKLDVVTEKVPSALTMEKTRLADKLPTEIFVTHILFKHFFSQIPASDLPRFAAQLDAQRSANQIELFSYQANIDKYYTTYLMGNSAVLFPSPSDSDCLYTYTQLERPRKDFLKTLVTEPHFAPESINLDDYRSIGINPGSECDEPNGLFNPLLFLHEKSNVTLLKRIYDHAVKTYSEITDITEVSHASFNYSQTQTIPICELLWPDRAIPATAQQIAAMNYYVIAQWAICTYQSTEEFDRHYAALLAQIDDRTHFFIRHKFLDYAMAMQNTVMINHLCLHHDFLKERLATIPILMEAGLHITEALKTAAKKPTVEEGQEYLHIARGILRACRNPADLQDEMNTETRKKIVLGLLKEYIADYPHHSKASRLQEAVIQNRGMDFFKDAKSNPPAKTYFFATPINDKEDEEKKLKKGEPQLLMNLFHFAKPLFLNPAKTQAININRTNGRRNVPVDETVVPGKPELTRLPFQRKFV